MEREVTGGQEVLTPRIGAEQVRQAAEVLRSLISRGVSKFLSLFRLSRSRSEIVATFLAVLELCKLKSISIDAEDADGDMNVTYLRMPEETVAKE